MHATGKAKTVIWRWQERFGEEGVTGLWRDKTSSRAHSATAPRGSRTRCGPDLGRTAADRQPLDRRGDGEGRWDQRQFGATDLACSWLAAASGRRFKLSNDSARLGSPGALARARASALRSDGKVAAGSDASAFVALTSATNATAAVLAAALRAHPALDSMTSAEMSG